MGKKPKGINQDADGFDIPEPESRLGNTLLIIRITKRFSHP